MPRPTLFGIVNITEDSFSDGGRHLDPGAAIAEALRLAAEGADVVDLGAAASNVAAKAVPPAEEIRRLDPVIAALKAAGIPVSVDSFSTETQRFAILREASISSTTSKGFPTPSSTPTWRTAGCRLIVMHAVHGRGRAQRVAVSPDAIWQRIVEFFTVRVAALEAAGIARERLILDPGMGFFLSSDARASLRVLAGLDTAETGIRPAGASLGVAQVVSRGSHRPGGAGGSRAREPGG